MPRTAKPPKVAETQQPPLFSVELFPDIPKLVMHAKAFIHTGKITCKDEERAAEIATAYLECQSILRVARRFHVSPNTVNAVVNVLEQAGKLDELKQRLSRSLGLLAEVSAEGAIQAVLDGKCPANVLPINVGVAIEKKALLDGEATSRLEAAVLVAPVQAQDVVAYLASQGIDVESTVCGPKAPQTEGAP